MASLAVALCVIAVVIFSGVAVTEINYVNGHPFAYGPAKVIAWAGGSGALLSVAVGLVAIVLLRRPVARAFSVQLVLDVFSHLFFGTRHRPDPDGTRSSRSGALRTHRPDGSALANTSGGHKM